MPASWRPAGRNSSSSGGSRSAYILPHLAEAASGRRWRRPRPRAATCALASEAAGVTETGLFSLSDGELGARGLELSTSPRGLDLDQLNALFSKVGFPKRENAKLLRALDHTMSLLWVKEAKTGRLVAFARATGDSVFNAIIWDVVVDPDHQGSGLGKAVMERLMSDLVERGIANIALYAEPNVVAFYKPLGFVTDPDGIRGMAYSKRKNFYTSK